MSMYSFNTIRRELTRDRPRPLSFPPGIDVTEDSLLPYVEARAYLGPLAEEIRAHAKLAIDTPIPPLAFSQFIAYEQTGLRQAYETPYFERRGRLLALALDMLLDGAKERSVEALENLVWEICGEYTWCLPACLPAGFEAATAARVPPECQVDLFAAETAHALAELLYLVGDRLHPWVGYRIRSEIERRVFRPLFYEPAAFNWESRQDNWSAVCGGAVGMAALLLERDKERLAGMIDRVLRSLTCFLESYGADGGCPEGLGYWFYGFGYYVYFADMLARYTDGALDLLASDKASAIAAFPAAFALSGGQALNYSDAGLITWHTGLLSRLAERLGTPVPEVKRVPPLNADGSYRWAHVTRNLLWTDMSLLDRPLPEGGTLFRDMEVAVDRRYIGGTMLAFSAKGGHNGESHNHNDLGHFILHVGGENLLADPGAGLYTRDYFGPARYSLLHNSSEGHSVPLLDGRPQLAGKAYAAELLSCGWEAERLRIEWELAKAYDNPKLASYRREFVWQWQRGDASGPSVPSGPNESCEPNASCDPSQAAVLELTDRFDCHEAPVQVVQQFVSLHRPRLVDGRCVWRGQKGEVTLHYDREAFAAEVLADNTQDFAGREQIVYRLRLRATAATQRMTQTFRFCCRVKNEANIAVKSASK